MIVERIIQPSLDLPVLTPDGGKPRVLMLVDRPDWAYDTGAQAISKRLADEFEFRIEYVRENPNLNSWKFDLIYVFFWGETYHQSFVTDPQRVIKEISSHRWANEDQYGKLMPQQAAEKYLSDAGTLTATSKRLQALFAPFRDVWHTPNGFEPGPFRLNEQRQGAIRIGWAGNENDSCKGLHDILRPAAGNDFELCVAGGTLSSREMAEFYNSVDVLCVASTAEGEPLTLIEGMACGCFPVVVDVGIVPELVTHRRNGLVVNRNPAAFRAAFQWCAYNASHVRQVGCANAETLHRERTWNHVSNHWRTVLRHAYRNLTAQPSALQTESSACTTTAGSLASPPVNTISGRFGVEPSRISTSVGASPASAATLDSASTMVTAGNQHKFDYARHLYAMNPGGDSDGAYVGASMYYRAEFQALFPADKDARLVDVGIGFGYLLRFALDLGYRRVSGVDLDPELYRIVQQKLGSRLEELVCQDARDFLRARPGRFDLVTLVDVLEHFPLDAAIDVACAAYESLTSGGILIIRVPNMASVLGIYSRYMDITHQHGYTEQSLAQLLRLAGFSEITVHVPEASAYGPLAAGIEESRKFHARLFQLQDRSRPTAFDKNVIVYARRSI